MGKKRIIAICGKGGVGKTILSGSLVRILSEKGAKILAVDADPAMGLSYILGLHDDIKTIGNVREHLIDDARAKKDPDEVAGSTDYLLLEALIETQRFDFLAMGRSFSRGCFCPINTLLKNSIGKLARNYDYVLVDAEAGVEQINREVMSEMNDIAVLVDGSQRSLRSMELIQKIVNDMRMNVNVGVILNRSKGLDYESINKQLGSLNTPLWGVIPEDEELHRNDGLGKSIFNLSQDSQVLESIRKAAYFFT